MVTVPTTNRLTITQACVHVYKKAPKVKDGPIYVTADYLACDKEVGLSYVTSPHYLPPEIYQRYIELCFCCVRFCLFSIIVSHHLRLLHVSMFNT